MIEMRLWRSVLVLAEELHYRRAAARLNISQPALTKQIQDIEIRLKVKLFERLDRQVQLTQEGEDNLDAIRKLIADAERLESTIKRGQAQEKRTLKVGSLEYIAKQYLPTIISQHQQTHPETQIEIADMTPHETISALVDGKIDIGLLVLPIEEPTLVTRTMVKGNWCVLVPDDHAFATLDSVEARLLSEQKLIFFARRVNPDLYDLLKRRFLNVDVEPNIAYHTQVPMMGPQLVLNGIGLFIVADYALPVLPAGLGLKPITGIETFLSFGAAWRQGSMTKPLRDLIDLLPKVSAV